MGSHDEEESGGLLGSAFSAMQAAQVEQERNIMTYFRYCPFCYKERAISFQWYIGKSYMFCEECGAKWEIHYSMWHGFVGARLVNPDVDGNGTNLLGQEQKPEFWQRMGLSGHKRSVPPPPPPHDDAAKREIIREKEVIIKVRCSYCHNVFDETLDKCPHCGGKR
jgi:hypothetical protein